MSDEDQKLLHRPFADFARDLGRKLRRKNQPPDTGKPLQPAVTTKKTTRAASVLDDEQQLFAETMRGVQPLSQRDDYLPPPHGAPPIPEERRDEAEVMAQLADLVSGRSAFDFTASDEHIEGIAVGLDRRLLKKLRQGHFACQAHIDLHGKTRQEARLLVEQFVLQSRSRGLRCVLIVHGRGLNSKDQIPVLKKSLNVWLARGRIARSVLCFCSARQVDGGAGAVYVLLRK